jgi:DNA-binding NarL/FixJ family response regulator
MVNLMYTAKHDCMFSTLIVEDSKEFRGTLTLLLGQRFPNIRIEEAEDSESALEKINLFEPDMVFMDIKLPGENGIVLTKHIKMAFSGVVVVILSSYNMPEYRQAAFRNGADCFITKGAASCMNDVLARVEGTLASKGIVHHRSQCA